MKILAIGHVIASTLVGAMAMAGDARGDAEFDAKVRDYLLRNPEVLIEMFAILEEQETESAKTRDADLIAQYGFDLFESGDPVLGKADAKHTIVEFIDYRCGYCRANEEVLAKYLDKNQDTRIIIKQFPILGEESRLMAETALAVFEAEGDVAFARVHDAFLAYGGPVNDQVLFDIVEDAGLDAASIMKLREDSSQVALRLGSVRRLARTFEIQGTPSFISATSVERGFLNVDAIDDFIGRGL